MVGYNSSTVNTVRPVMHSHEIQVETASCLELWVISLGFGRNGHVRGRQGGLQHRHVSIESWNLRYADALVDLDAAVFERDGNRGLGSMRTMTMGTKTVAGVRLVILQMDPCMASDYCYYRDSSERAGAAGDGEGAERLLEEMKYRSIDVDGTE